MKVLTGKAFAFIHREIARGDLNANDHIVLCALGQEPEVNGFQLPRLSLPPGPKLCIATCDKELYYEQRDRVNIMLYAPGRSELQLELRQGPMLVSRHQCSLGQHGEGQLSFHHLPNGDYKVTQGGETLCKFKVAAYTLAPLVGTLLHRVKESENILRVTLRVESYGQPLQGGVWLTLRSGYGNQRRTFALACDGLIEALLEFEEDASYALDIQHAEKTELTATVPLPGTRKSERRSVVLSPLNPIWKGSLLPCRDSVETREFHLTQTSHPNSPFRLERIDSRRAQLTAQQAASPVKVAVIDPSTDIPTVHHWDSLEEGQCVEFDLPSPLGILALGAYIEDQPWEAWAMTVAPTELECEITLPSSVQAGKPVEIQVQTAMEGALYLLVKDARLACRQRPGDRLAARIQEAARVLKPEAGPVRPRSNTVDQQRRLEELMERVELTDSQREVARRQARWTECTAEEILMSAMGLTRQEFLSELWGVDMANLGDIDYELTRTVPEHLARRYRCLPLRSQDNTLVLAMADPFDVIAIDDFRLITGFHIEPLLADEAAIMNALNSAYGVTDLVEVEETVKDISAQDFGPLEFEDDDELIALDKLKTSFSDPGPTHQDLDEPAENDKAEVLYAGWVELEQGRAQIELPTPAQPGEIVVEAFAVSGFDWSTAEARVQTEKPLILSFDCPPFVHPQDEVVGALRIVCGQPPFRLEVTRDGQTLDLPEVQETLKPLTFNCTPGHYQAKVEEIITGHTETIELEVAQAGRMSGLKRTVQWLRKGDRLDRRLEPGILGLDLLADADKPAVRLGKVTTNYSHHCCEQTAAKILAAMCLWMSNPCSELESVIRAGIEREKKMYLPGRGFAMYPGMSEPCSYWGSMAAQYLCQLVLMAEKDLSPELKRLVQDGLAMAHDAVKAYGSSWPPLNRETAQDCYLEYRFGEPDAKLLALARNGFGDEGWGSVGKRRAMCYQAAILLRSGEDGALAVQLLNEVFQAFNESGGLYSTADSIAALLVYEELMNCQFEWLAPNLTYEQGELMAVAAGEGDVLVEVTRAYSEDWSELQPTTRLEAALKPAQTTAGQLVELELALPDGYREGDLVWVCLPRSLAQLQGGGQLRQFSVDFEGKDKLTLNLVALAPTAGETVMVCLRNMFLEERVALADPLRIEVARAAMSGESGLDLPRVLCTADLTRNGLQGAPETMEQVQTLSRNLHQPELVDFLEALLGKAQERGAQKLILDLVDEGQARCRLKTEHGMTVLMRYPSPIQTLLVGRLQMLSKNALGSWGPQEGEVELSGRNWPVSILPTSLGMMATLVLEESKSDKLAWLRVLSRLQQDLSQDRPPDLEALRQARPDGEDPAIDELMEVLETDPVSKRHALAALARLAKS